MPTTIDLSGLLFINGEDMWRRFGVFLYEERAGETKNYSALLKPTATKPIKAVSYAEENGERMPQTIKPTLQGREVTLVFGILAPSSAFIARYQGFLELLRSGWLELRVSGIDTTFKMHYLAASDYKQLTGLEDEMVGAYLSVKLHEPKPHY